MKLTMEFYGLAALVPPVASAPSDPPRVLLIKRFGHEPKLLFPYKDLKNYAEVSRQAGPFGGVRIVGTPGALYGEIDLTDTQVTIDGFVGTPTPDTSAGWNYATIAHLKELTQKPLKQDLQIGSYGISAVCHLGAGTLSGGEPIDQIEWDMGGTVRRLSNRIAFASSAEMMQANVWLSREGATQPVRLRLVFETSVVLAVSSLCCVKPGGAGPQPHMLYDMKAFDQLVSGGFPPPAFGRGPVSPEIPDCPPLSAL